MPKSTTTIETIEDATNLKGAFIYGFFDGFGRGCGYLLTLAVAVGIYKFIL